MQNPFADLIPEQETGPVVIGTPRPRQAAPVTPNQDRYTGAQADRTAAEALFAEEKARADAAKADADAKKAAIEAAVAQQQQERRRALAGNARTQLQSLLERIDRIEADAKDNRGWGETGWTGSLLRNRPGTAAFDLAADLKTLDASAAFKALQQMREESPTGGALGQITERELDLLKSTISNLDPNQSQDSFLRSLDVARKTYKNMIDRLPGGEQSATVVNPGEVRFNDETPENAEGRRFTPQQQKAWEALLRTKPTPGQIDSFLKAVGFAGGANSADVAAAAAQGLINPDVDYSRSDEEYREQLRQEAERRNQLLPGQAAITSDTAPLHRQGVTLGLSDEASGVGGFVSSLLTGRNPVEGYRRARDTERVLVEDARAQKGWGGTAVEVGSGLLSGNPSALARLPTLGGRVRESAKTGAKVGALAGYGYGEGAEGSTLSALGGGAAGAGIGAALPVVGALATNRARGLRSLFGDPGETAGRQIRSAFEADGITPRAAGAAMDEAQGRGVPAMLADQGENLRNLLGSVTRQPGPSRALALPAVTERQMGQADRISGAIARDLGPVSNPHEVSEQLIEQARTTAAPLYEAFRAASGASSVRLDDLSQRPAFREALKKARGIIEEEGGDPTALGFDLDEAGEVVLTRVPSWEALDYVKRGLDDVVYAKRNPLTGAPELTNETRAVNNTRRMLLSRMDAINPTYAEARAAYAGPVAGKDALERGLKALRLGADDITAQTKRMSPFELDQYRLGVRRAMTELVASKGDTADKISALTGSPKKREALQRLFGGSENFNRFMATLGDERAAQLTYQRAATGSPTALNAAVDLLTNDTGLAETAVDAALRGSRDTLWGNVVQLLQRARQAEQFGAGRAGQEARESIAAALTQTDPVELRAVFREAARAMARRRVQERRRTRRTSRIGGRTGQAIGSGIGATTQETVSEPR